MAVPKGCGFGTMALADSEALQTLNLILALTTTLTLLLKLTLTVTLHLVHATNCAGR